MNKETILTAIQFLMACENQNPEDIRLAAAHFEACMKWETEMKAITGRDSIEGVKQYIIDLNHKLTNRTQELNDIRALMRLPRGIN